MSVALVVAAAVAAEAMGVAVEAGAAVVVAAAALVAAVVVVAVAAVVTAAAAAIPDGCVSGVSGVVLFPRHRRDRGGMGLDVGGITVLPLKDQ